MEIGVAQGASVALWRTGSGIGHLHVLDFRQTGLILCVR
jgi:hypothetical protein